MKGGNGTERTEIDDVTLKILELLYCWVECPSVVVNSAGTQKVNQ